MASNGKFELPGSGYDVLEKILHAYAYSGDRPASLDDVAARAGMGRTMVSPNHAFLISVGLLTNGNKKQLTPAGQRLALAISNKVPDEVSAVWAEVMQGCEHTRKVLEMVRVQGKIDKSALPGRILNTLTIAGSKNAKTGANCLVDVFEKADLIVETDGKYAFNASVRQSEQPNNELPAKNAEDTHLPAAAQLPDPPKQPAVSTPDPSVHIDIQIHIDADASADQIDQVFASMAKHLYGRG